MNLYKGTAYAIKAILTGDLASVYNLAAGTVPEGILEVKLVGPGLSIWCRAQCTFRVSCMPVLLHAFCMYANGFAYIFA